MRQCVTDTEVFAYDNIVVFLDIATGFHHIFHNDNESVREFMDEDPDTLYYTCNGKHYDRFILEAMYLDFHPEEIKEINDFIIKGGEGWDHPLLRDQYFKCNIVDLFDDMQVGLSLKAIEAHLGMNIKESEVSFDISRPLKVKEIEESVAYCVADVDATFEYLKLRKDYLNTKLRLGRQCGLDDAKALSMTNARLTAVYLGAERKVFSDEREYSFPENLNRKYLPQAVISFYDRIHDMSIDSETLFSMKFEGNIGECAYTLGFGGIHGDCGKVIVDSNEDCFIVNQDVASYYPHLMTINGYCSRAMKDPGRFEDVLEARMNAKASGEKKIANDLKLVINTTYGAMLAPWNDLYDPLMGRSVCISGQLYLLELAYHLHKSANAEIIQLNTDGIMFRVSSQDEYTKAFNITDEWQSRTGYELEADSIHKVIQKDVNNYIELKDNGDIKVKGGYLVRGIGQAGAFKINNNMPIVSKAVIDYFILGEEPFETIYGCSDILQFQIIAKASHKYSEVFLMEYGHRKKVQNVNRVYAAKDPFLGSLYKIHKDTGGISKIPSLPDSCIVDNTNELTLEDIDRSWYVNLAWKYISDFTGQNVKRKRNISLTRKLNNILKGV